MSVASQLCLGAEPLSISVWRICIGLSLIPAFSTLYQRLTLPESKRFQKSQQLDGESSSTLKEKDVELSTSDDAVADTQPTKKEKAHFKGIQSSSFVW